MENLYIEPTTVTPEITFNAESGDLKISGKSLHENPFEFYERLGKWVDEYAGHPQPNTVISIDLHYCNTSSSKCVLNFIKRSGKIKEKGSNLVIKWVYDEGDDDTFEAGNDFTRLTKIPFEFVEKPGH